MFEVGADNGDVRVEFQFWVERRKLFMLFFAFGDRVYHVLAVRMGVEWSDRNCDRVWEPQRLPCSIRP